MKNVCSVSVLLAVMLLVPSDGGAVVAGEVIVDKPLNPATGYGFSSHYGQQHVFEDFVLQSSAAFNRITWYGLFSEGTIANDQAVGSFDLFLFHNNPEDHTITSGGILVTNLPADPAFYSSSASSVLGAVTGVADPLQGGDIKRWSMDVPALSLDSGRYWISIRASSSEPGFFLWHHTEVGADGYTVHGSISTNNVPSFVVSDEALERDEMAFSLGFIPEPTTFTLLGLGSLVLAAMKRRR